MDRRSAKHGRTQFFIEGEGFTNAALPVPSRLKAMGAADAPPQAYGSPPPPPQDPARAFRFCRLFKLDPFLPTEDALIALGQALTNESFPPDPSLPPVSDTDIPAGFTYFGQFVDHDITFDRTELIPSGSVDPAEIENGRTPALELDSVYGRGPDLSPELYEADKIRLKIGTTTGRDIFGQDMTVPLPNDLPRKPPSNDPDDRKAIIGDPRNDENLIVAQTHLAFLKFHNKVVEKLQAAGTPAKNLFAEARKTVIQHYQSIVLHDFVARLVDPDVFSDVTGKGRKAFFPKQQTPGKHLCMPVEFSVAAYRLGHSLIRTGYQWNLVFSSTGRFGRVPNLGLFFVFSRVSGDIQGFDTVPTDWVVDWRRMFNFGEAAGGVTHPQLNFARPIDIRLASALNTLPEFANAQPAHLQSLAVRNLLRGRLVGLPSGQAVANAMGETPLTPAEVASEPHSALVTSLGFDKDTPLWFYILKEAEVQQGGKRLGRVGSRLVAETFHGLVASSEHSILAQKGWKTSLTATPTDKYTMVDLLTFVDDINPLGKIDPNAT